MNSFGQELSFNQGSDFHLTVKGSYLCKSEHKDGLQVTRDRSCSHKAFFESDANIPTDEHWAELNWHRELSIKLRMRTGFVL